jgi:hypothetical protein
MIKLIRKIRIGLLHAAYHRNMRKAETARSNQNILKFKKHVYAAEDAWRKLVILIEKNKQNG